MRGRVLHVCAVVLVGVSILAPAPDASAATSFEIENCSDDSQPGHEITAPGTYVLARAVVFCTSDPVIRITASNVTVDLNGFLVDGVDDTDIGIALGTSTTGVVVRNGTLSDFSVAVALAGTGNVATRLTLQSNDFGISTFGGEESVISSNTVVGNDDIGIEISSGTDGYRVKGNTVARNANRGIQAASGSDGLFADNLVAANGADGIAVVQSGNNNAWIGNRIIGNGGDGIHSEPANISASSIRSNVVTGNDGDGIDAGSSGSIVRNRVTGNGNRGIAAGNDGNTIKRNTVRGNLSDGIFIASPDAQTTIADNRTIGNGLEGINASPFTGSGSGTNAAWANGTGNVGIGPSGTFECTPEPICHSAVPRAIRKGKVKPVEIDCSADPGLVIDKPGRYLLTRAVVDCDAEPAVSIDANNVSFSLGGALVDWDIGGGVQGILTAPGRTGVTVRSGTISDYEYAVEFAGTGSVVEAIVARGTNAGLNGGTGNTFRRNTITRSGNTGVTATSAHILRNTIAGNALGGSTGGIDASGGVVRNNLVIGNHRSGINGDDALISGNRVIGNAWRGIEVNSDCTVEDNVVVGNGGHGIDAGNPDNTIRGNAVVGNGGDPTFGVNGIRAANGGNKLVGNVVRASNASGIFIDVPVSSTTTIKDNRAHGNGAFGINAAPFDGRGLGTNVARGNVETAECDPSTLCT